MLVSNTRSSINIAYISVIAIWATTPLAIKWSNDSLTPITAVSGRMLLAALLGVLIALLTKRRTSLKRRNARLYFVASLGLFPNMPIVYYAAQTIPSGMISVLFALSPFMVGFASILFLRENPFTPGRVFALLLAVAGLCVIFGEQFTLGDHAMDGITLMILSVCLFSLSSVWVKKLSQNVDAFEQTLGALVFSLPGLLLCWYLTDGAVPTEISVKSGLSLLYLATFGSLLGFAAYFYVVQQMSVAAMSVIPLMTPVFALILGYCLNDEVLSKALIIGTVMIMIALAIYQGKTLKSSRLWSYRRV